MRGENYSPFDWAFQEQDKVTPSGGGEGGDGATKKKVNEIVNAKLATIGIGGEGGDGVTKKKVNEIVDAKLATIGIGGEGLEYILTVDGEPAGVINIPKDQFLKSVSYNKETQNLVFVMETESGEVTTQLGTFATTERGNSQLVNRKGERDI